MQKINNILFFVLALFLFILCGTNKASCDEVLVLQSLKVKPYNEALKGIANVIGNGHRTIYTSEVDKGVIINEIESTHPSLIIAIGLDALQKVKDIKTIPIIYTMISQPDTVITRSSNITGVSMDVRPDRQIQLIQSIMPGIKNIGIFYDPSKSSGIVNKIQEAVNGTNIRLIAKSVRSGRDVSVLLNDLKGKIDLIWMIPDTTVLTQYNVELFLVFSMQTGVPVVSFSGKYVEMGATVSFDVNAYELGGQTGKLAKKILKGASAAGVPPEDAQDIIITVNQKVLSFFGFQMPKELLSNVRFVNKE